MLLGSMAQNAFAQKIEIKGTVRDASDKSIEYVNVVLQTIDSTFVAGVTTSQKENSSSRTRLPEITDLFFPASGIIPDTSPSME